MKGEHRKFAKFLSQYGLSLESGGKHILIKRDGKMLSSLGSTLSDEYAYAQAIRHLVRSGDLPNSAKGKFKI